MSMPLSVFFSLTPPLLPRVYSICSSAKARCPASSSVFNLKTQQTTKHSLSFTYSPITFEEGEKTRTGLCSAYLASRKIDDKVPQRARVIVMRAAHLVYKVRVVIEETPFHLPNDPEVPIVMIGSGTAISPFMGFLQERSAIKRDTG